MPLMHLTVGYVTRTLQIPKFSRYRKDLLNTSGVRAVTSYRCCLARLRPNKISEIHSPGLAWELETWHTKVTEIPDMELLALNHVRRAGEKFRFSLIVVYNLRIYFIQEPTK